MIVCPYSSVCDLISQRVQDTPHSVALSQGEVTLSYIELDAACTRLSNILLHRGIKAGNLVPVLTTRCLEAIVCLLGVLRIGACYVPVDLESWNPERIIATLEIIKARTLITTGVTSFLPYDNVTAQEVRHAIRPGSTSTSSAIELPQMQSSDLAYVIFTSGTTSVPKGVMVPHRALVNYVQQGGEQTPFNMNVKPSDNVLLLMSIAFDACTGVVFSTLCNGGTLLISSPTTFAEDAKSCSILPATPSLLNTIQQPEMYKNIRGIYLGGEAPSRTLVKAWSTPIRKLFNCYGPTETTCASLITELQPHQPITLGYPMSNSEVILLKGDDEVLDEGEICISGPGLATGYFENPELTDQKFREWNGTVFYRTGDIAKRTANGLEFVGRVDALVKNRGFLINLEAQVIPALQDCPKVKSASAFMCQGRLVGFVTPSSISGQALRTILAAQHDSFIVPDHIFSLDALPLTGNGKIDRCSLQKSLLEPAMESIGHALNRSALAVLQRCLSISLKIAVNDINNSVSFWDLGGNSLAGIMLVSQLHSHGYAISLPQLFQLQNIDQIAESMTRIASVASGEAPDSRAVAIPQSVSPDILVPMSIVQLKMLRMSIEKPLVNYMLLSINMSHVGLFPSSKFRCAIETMFDRHSIFRTSFDLGKETQVIKPRSELDWQELTVDARSLRSACDEQKELIRKRIYESAGESAATSIVDPATIFRLVSTAYGSTCLLWMIHHSRVDGWSMGLFFEELQAILDHQELQISPQFSDVARAQIDVVKQDRKRAVDFWSQALNGHLPPSPILLPKPDTSIASEMTAQKSLLISLAPAQLDYRARSFKVTSATIIYSAWALLLSRYSASNKITFGTVFSGRNITVPLAHRVMGPLINTCPLAVQIDDGATVGQMLSTVQQRLFQMNELQWSAAEAMSEIAPEDQAAVFDTIVALQYDLPEVIWDCKSVTGPWQITREETSEFSLTALIECKNNELALRILYNTERFESSAIDDLLMHFNNLISGIIDSTSQTVNDVRRKMIHNTEIVALTQHSTMLTEEYSGATSLKDAFEEAVQKWPHYMAVDSVDGSMTYQQLDEASNHVAGHLATTVRPGDLVTIVSDGSLSWIISILGVVKTGAAYCPIDVKLPAERAKTIQTESKSSLCLMPSRKLWEVFGLGLAAKIVFTEDMLAMGDAKNGRLPTKTSPHDTACIVFTSGSTGKPKGVQAHHLGILSYISFPPARLHAGPGRRNAQLFSVGFDACTAEIFGTLCYGATLVLKDPEHPFDHLQHVDATMATPSFLSTCRTRDLKNLDTILLGGEAVSQDLADTWSKGRRLYNGYGPCECTVGSVFKQLRPGEKVTLGRPIPRMTAYLLDDRLCPVPVGVPGEIYLSGIQVTKGYFQLKAQTEVSFITDPFAHGRIMYRTGDLGRWTPAMELQFVGRVDTQVKVRGYRLELAAIETTIRDVSPEVTNVAVIVRDDALRCFVTPESVDGSLVREKLRSVLPSYSRPAQIIALKTFPLSVNQKVDRKALEQLVIKSSESRVPLTNATEAALARIWQHAIGSMKYPEPSANDDFMDIGGHSLLQITVGRYISEEFGLPIPLALIIRNPVLRQLAAAVDKLLAEHQNEFTEVEPFSMSQKVSRDDDLTISHLEEEMMVYHSLTDTRSIFNMPCRIKIKGKLSIEALKQAIDTVIAESEILRCQYAISRHMRVGRIISNALPTPYFSAGQWGERAVATAVNKPFNLQESQLIRALILGHSDECNELLLVTHHIIADKAALTAMLTQVQKTYVKLLERPDPTMPQFKTARSEQTSSPSELSYIDWASWAKKRVVSRDVSKYWEETLAHLPLAPFSSNRYLRGEDAGTSITVPVPSALKDAMLQTSRAYSITNHQLILAVVALTTHIFTANCNDMVLAIPYMDRYEPGVSGLHGLFLDRQPIRIRLSSMELSSCQTFLQLSKNAVLDARANYMPFSEIRKTLRMTAPTSLFDIMVTFHPRSDSLETFQLPGTSTQFQRLRADGAKFPLMFEFSEDVGNGDLTCELEYNTHLFKESQIAQLRTILFRVMEGLCNEQPPCEIISSLHDTGLEVYSNPAKTKAVATKVPTKSKDQGKIDIVREVYADVLGLQKKDVSCQQSFFELGGSSMGALSVVHDLREKGLPIDFRDLLRLESADKVAALA